MVRSIFPARNPYRSGECVHFPELLYIRPVPEKRPSSGRVSNPHGYKGTLLHVHLEGGTWGTIEGTAVMVAPGVALTASHVLSDYFNEIKEGKAYVILQGYLDDGPIFWCASYFTNIVGTDLLLITLELRSDVPSDNCFRIAPMRVTAPAPGSFVRIVGMVATGHSSDGTFPVVDGIMNYSYDTFEAAGAVEERTQPRLINGPSISVNCGGFGGMSGGPAYDEDGYVIGVLSASFEGPSQEETLMNPPAPATISLLSPALQVPVRPSWFPGEQTYYRRLSEMRSFIDDPSKLVQQSCWKALEFKAGRFGGDIRKPD